MWIMLSADEENKLQRRNYSINPTVIEKDELIAEEKKSLTLFLQISFFDNHLSPTFSQIEIVIKKYLGKASSLYSRSELIKPIVTLISLFRLPTNYSFKIFFQ